MLKPVAAVGGALALVGAGTIGSISLMENFVLAGINGEAACDENPVGQVGPFKSTLDFGCTKDSTVTTGTGATVAETYANFVEGKLESVPTSEFWPLFPVRNTFGLKPSIEQGLSDGLGQLSGAGIKTVKQAQETFSGLLQIQSTGQLSAEQQVLFAALSSFLPQLVFFSEILAYEFETCEKAYGTSEFLGAPYGLAVLGVAVEGSIEARIEDEIKKTRKDIEEGNDLLTAAQMPNFFGPTFCTGTAQSINSKAGSQVLNPADCDNVVDFVVPNGDELAPVRSARIGANPDAKSFVEVVEAWLVVLGANPSLEQLVSEDTKSLALLCQQLQYPALVGGTAYTALSITPNDCKLAYSVGGPADETFKERVSDAVRSFIPQITSAVVDGITGVPVTNLTDPAQVAQLVVKCKEQEEDLAAIEQAQILLPGGAAAAGLAALLLFVAVATAKAPLVLAGGFLGVVGGVVTLVALLGVKNAPVYADVGGVVKPGEVEYKQGLGATLGLVGIGAPVIGGLLGVGSFFCGSDEG